MTTGMHWLKRFRLMGLALGLFFSPVAMGAARPATISATPGYDYVFAQQMTFKLDATSDARITRAVVYYQSDRGVLQIGEATFEPGTTIHVEVTIELRGGVIPPFSAITYWWDITDEAEQRLTTPRAAFDYIDNRFEWQQVSESGITVNWTAGEADFGETALDIASEALPVIADEIGIAPPSDIVIYIYPSRDDLINALRLGGRDWAAGQARPELGVVLVDIAPTTDSKVQMRRLIPHELTHLVVYQATQPNYDAVPAWLDEGLATANEGSPDPALAVALKFAVDQDRLFPLTQLCAPFSSNVSEALLAYAQSGSLIQFVRDRYGGQGIRDLLSVYRERASCEPGVERALKVTLPAFENEWRAQFASGAQTAGAVAEASAPWLTIWLVTSLALLPILGGLPLIARRKSSPR